MFELMTKIERPPLEEKDIVQIHKGMSSLRVSVGEHISQPSEVYIVTGRQEDLYQTFIIFFMIEPQVHVVYRFEENPYDPDRQEEVLGGAFQFVEEMGGIMEEIPFDTMSPENRLNLMDDLGLFPADSPEASILEDLEEIQLGEIIEVLGDEDAEEASEFEVLVEDDEEGDTEEAREAGGAEGIQDFPVRQPPPETSETISEPGEKEDKDLDSDEDRDLDLLLKQAFLKPELIRKVSGKKTRSPEEGPVDGSAPPETEGKEGEIPVDSGPPEVEALENPEPGFPVRPVQEEQNIIEDILPEEGASPEAAASPAGDERVAPEKVEGSLGVKVIKFLSRF